MESFGCFSLKIHAKHMHTNAYYCIVWTAKSIRVGMPWNDDIHSDASLVGCVRITSNAHISAGFSGIKFAE